MPEHPITPPPELVREWAKGCSPYDVPADHIATQAARWGADQELEACCEVLARELICDGKHVATDLRAARRPKPPSLAKEALETFMQLPLKVWGDQDTGPVLLKIRRALERLQELENNG